MWATYLSKNSSNLVTLVQRQGYNAKLSNTEDLEYVPIAGIPRYGYKIMSFLRPASQTENWRHGVHMCWSA
jgi:hypothetical protein